MNEDFKKWYSLDFVRQSFRQFIPLVNKTGLVRECAVIWRGENGEKKVGRNVVFYSLRKLDWLCSGKPLHSILASLDQFHYVFDKETELTWNSGERELKKKGDLLPLLRFASYTANENEFDEDIQAKTGYYNRLASVDFLLDLDSCDLMKLEDRNTVLTLWSELEKDFGANNVFFKHSGNHGGHFLIPAQAFQPNHPLNALQNSLNSEEREFKSTPSVCRAIAARYAPWTRFLGGDDSIYNQKRIFRLVFSIHEGSGNISLPLKKEDLAKPFDINEFSVSKSLEIAEKNPDFFISRRWNLESASYNPAAFAFVKNLEAESQEND